MNVIRWIGRKYKRIVTSIAFYPAFIACLFLGLSYLMIYIDFSETGKQIKAQMEWLKLKDASTARTIISVIATGILSLTVFSFTMVMVILNQAASQMSNRVLDKLIGNRFQQIVLGIYIGTIVYSLFLLSAIRDIDTGIYVPSLSTYLLIAFAIINIFLFIYFLHYITQSIKYGVIIMRIRKQTYTALKKTCRLQTEPVIAEVKKGLPVKTSKAGIYNGFHKESLLSVVTNNDCIIHIIQPLGTYLLEGSIIAEIISDDKTIDEDLNDHILQHITLHETTTIDDNFYYGFRQLSEVAIKALSPGINDPGTAVESLRALFHLCSYRLSHFPDNVVKDKNGKTRIITNELNFSEIFKHTILPVWDYGKQDRYVQKEIIHLLELLQEQHQHQALEKLYKNAQQHLADTANEF